MMALPSSAQSSPVTCPAHAFSADAFPLLSAAVQTELTLSSPLALQSHKRMR